MRGSAEHTAPIHAVLTPELAAWILRVTAKELRRAAPTWARLDPGELARFLMLLHDSVPARYRTDVPVLPERGGGHAA